MLIPPPQKKKIYFVEFVPFIVRISLIFLSCCLFTDFSTRIVQKILYEYQLYF
jgi:hypothetical protein